MLLKRKSHAFGKDVYLLGRDKYGDYLWLEAASWDCGWYWGFGYVETYTRQLDPANSRDINSHTHYSSLIWKKEEDGKNPHHLNQVLEESTLTDSESWRLADLMKTFYTLKESAEVLGRGYSHLTSLARLDVIKQPAMVKIINETLLPAIFAEVYTLLTSEV